VDAIGRNRRAIQGGTLKGPDDQGEEEIKRCAPKVGLDVTKGEEGKKPESQENTFKNCTNERRGEDTERKEPIQATSTH